MSDAIAIVGESGSGKSRSIKKLDPDTTFVINLVNKPLPFRGSKKKYRAKPVQGRKQNYIETRNPAKILAVLETIDKKAKYIENVVIDDFQYLMSGVYMDRAKEKGWEKFLDIGQYVWKICRKAANMREGVKIFFLCHEETIRTGEFTSRRKMKTIGKLIDDKITMEGLFTVVLFTFIDPDVEEGQQQSKYGFITQSDGITTAKSPEGMFPGLIIPNDLSYVSRKIDEYWEDDSEDEDEDEDKLIKELNKNTSANGSEDSEPEADSEEKISEEEENSDYEVDLDDLDL